MLKLIFWRTEMSFPPKVQRDAVQQITAQLAERFHCAGLDPAVVGTALVEVAIVIAIEAIGFDSVVNQLRSLIEEMGKRRNELDRNPTLN
jgi:hypothetical protein